MNDLKFALRQLLKNPGFGAVAEFIPNRQPQLGLRVQFHCFLNKPACSSEPKEPSFNCM
jgi:hypothetical protein